MQLQQTIKSFIRPGEQSGYVAECLEISVVTQGETLDEVVKNLQEEIHSSSTGNSPTNFTSGCNHSDHFAYTRCCTW